MCISKTFVSHLRWSVDFSGYSGLLPQLTDIHDTTMILTIFRFHIYRTFLYNVMII